MTTEESLSVRQMELGDIPQVADIEREAFPKPWPATDFRHELLFNRSSFYMVVDIPQTAQEIDQSTPDRTNHHAKPILGELKNFLKSLFGQKAPPASGSIILGYSGLWFMADEAHLANIAVRKGDRGKGIGELLVIKSLECAMERNSSLMTLEVRQSNLIAQALYRKYGLVPVGVRRGYYTDNKEDALIMTVSAIQSPAFRSTLERLKQNYREKWQRPS